MKRYLGAVLVAASAVACGQSQDGLFSPSTAAGNSGASLGGNAGSASGGAASSTGGSANSGAVAGNGGHGGVSGTVGGTDENGGASGSDENGGASGDAGATAAGSAGLSGQGGASAGGSAGSGGASGGTSGGASAGGNAGTGGASGGGSGGAPTGGIGGSAGASGTGGSGGSVGGSGGSAGTGGSGVVETAFRMDTLELRDTHLFVNFIGCVDVTNPPGLEGTSVNGEFATAISTDGGTDGLLDLSPVLLFAPLNQTDASTTSSKLIFAGCTAPEASTHCSPHGATAVSSTATTMSTGTCLAPVTGTTNSAYTPAVLSTTGPCFSSSAPAIALPLLGIEIPLTDVHWAARYVGSPATSLTNGLLSGFLTQASADAAVFPASVPFVAGQPLSSVLPGGTNSCRTSSDKDTDNGVVGWWLYFNFTAKSVPWSDQP